MLNRFFYRDSLKKTLASQEHTVSGMLLYARTVDEIQPDVDFLMSGNKISVKTLDLNKPFTNISRQLDQIAAELSCGNLLKKGVGRKFSLGEKGL